VEQEERRLSSENSAEMVATARSSVNAAVRSLAWEGTRSEFELIAWVHCWVEDENWAMRFQILPSAEVGAATPVGRPEVRVAGQAAVERYLSYNQAKLEGLLRCRPRPKLVSNV
jgi:hypothetical protein